MYLPTHRDAASLTEDPSQVKSDPTPKPEPASPKSYVNTDKALLEAYLDLNSDHQKLLLQINVLGHEIELVSKMVRDFGKARATGNDWYWKSSPKFLKR
jgi:hypothetical protein